MKTKTIYTLLFATFFLSFLIGCKKDSDSPQPISPTTPPVNEEELITSLIISFIDTAGIQPSVQYAFRDPDGDGGSSPTQHDTIRLVANTYYYATVQLLNESVSPAEDITLEVKEEATEHLFCYVIANTNVSIVRTDTDGTFELGIESRWFTGGVANGATTISLKHQPGVKDGTCTPGDTDVEVTFVTEIQ
jgi:hypothetical protein